VTLALLALAAEGGGSLPFLLIGLWVLLLGTFLGFVIIQRVPPTLHTPLMSGSNAISGITVLGALYCVGSDFPLPGKIMGAIAIVAAMINVIGGFVVTHRMLGMFQGKRGGGERS
jgi:NAD(P) transhydrogenase subunit alpha